MLSDAEMPEADGIGGDGEEGVYKKGMAEKRRKSELNLTSTSPEFGCACLFTAAALLKSPNLMVVLASWGGSVRVVSNGKVVSLVFKSSVRASSVK